MVTPVRPGTVLPLVREMTGSPDPHALYAALSEGGRAPGTFLLESAETGAGSGERSLIGARAALRVACFGRIVEIEARSANGRSLLPWIAERLRQDGTSRELECSVTRLRVQYPDPPPGARDESARVKLPSPLDALRTTVFGPEVLAHPTDACYLAAGVFSYDLVELFENLPAGRPEVRPVPHFEFYVPDRLMIIDHVRNRTLLVANAMGGEGGEQNYHDAVSGIGSLLKSLESGVGGRVSRSHLVPTPDTRPPTARSISATRTSRRWSAASSNTSWPVTFFRSWRREPSRCPAATRSPPTRGFGQPIRAPISSMSLATARPSSAPHRRPR